MTQTGGIYHHPDYFDEPETFKPERYLNNPNGTKKGVNTTGFHDNLSFGAGRVCLFAPVPMHSYNGLFYLSSVFVPVKQWQWGLLFVANLSACGSANPVSSQMLNTMNLLWAFNFAKDKSGTGNWDIDSYAGVNSLCFYNYQSPSHFLSSLAWCSPLSHTHAPSLPEMKNGRISSSNHLNTMGNPFKLCIYLWLYLP